MIKNYHQVAFQLLINRLLPYLAIVNRIVLVEVLKLLAMEYRQHAPAENGILPMAALMQRRMSAAYLRLCKNAAKQHLEIVDRLLQKLIAASLLMLKPLLCKYKSGLVYIIAASFFIISAQASYAQVSGSVSAETDSWFRGRSISQGQPVVSGSLSYDDISGIYGGTTIAFTIGEQNQGPLSFVGLLGYAKNIDTHLSIDTGATVTAYTERYSGMANDTFVEFHTGLSYKNLTGRIRYSPDFQELNAQTIYVEIDTIHRLGDGFNASAHAGLLQQVGGSGSLGDRSFRYDLSLGLSKDIGLWSVNGSINYGGDRGGTYFSGPWRVRDAIILGVSRSF